LEYDKIKHILPVASQRRHPVVVRLVSHQAEYPFHPAAHPCHPALRWSKNVVPVMTSFEVPEWGRRTT
jgi:hypothetical protein